MKLVDKAGAYARRAEGMRNAEEGVDEVWYRAAVAFVTRYCRKNEEMFCDDLWKAGLTIPREARALGPVIMQCARDGVIERSGRYRASVGSNMTPKPVWRSLVYKGKRTHWYLVKRKNGAYVANPYVSRRSGRRIVFWVRSRAKAKRWAKRAEAFEVSGGIQGARVVSARIRRIRVRPATEDEVRRPLGPRLRSKRALVKTSRVEKTSRTRKRAPKKRAVKKTKTKTMPRHGG